MGRHRPKKLTTWTLIKSVKAEVEKPFKEKLERTLTLLKLFANDEKACIACSFGKDSLVVLYLALGINPKIKVQFSDTGIEFPETIKLARQLRDQWNLNLSITKPQTTFWKLLDRIKREKLTLDDGRKHSNICCYHLKEKPFKLWAKKEKVNRSITGITAIESRHRMFVACKKGMEYYAYRDKMWKVHPLLYWTTEEVWDFIAKNNIPVNEAYKKYNIDRVGCMWCMSHLGWREQIARINPKVYAFMQKKYFNQMVF